MKRLTSLLLAGRQEHKHKPFSEAAFAYRMYRCLVVSAMLFLITISIGGSAYHWLDQERWVDAFLNAIMVMTGLGLVGSLTTTAAKIFTSFYALLSSVVFFLVLGILFAPLIHRFLHKFHLELDKDK